MGKKGWWRQLQTGEYAETQLSYGQDMMALRKQTGGWGRQPSEGQKIREPAKLIYDPEYIKKQNQPTNKTSPLESITLPAPRKKKRFKSKSSYKSWSTNKRPSPIIYCKKCGHKKPIDRDMILSVRLDLARFRCTICGTKSAGIISSKGRRRTFR